MQQLKENNIPYKKGNFPFLANGKSQTMSNVHGFVKTLFNSDTGEFLGAHLIGPDVTEMISTFGLAMTSESTEDEFINTIFRLINISKPNGIIYKKIENSVNFAKTFLRKIYKENK